jgi:hypothetical protein
MKLEPESPTSPPGSEPEPKGESEVPLVVTASRCVTEEEAGQILSRLRLSAGIKKILGVLHHARDPISSEDLKTATGLHSDEFRGVMGGFGRRVTHSVGKNVVFFVKEWRQEQFFWGLPESVKRAMENLNVI